MKRNLFTTFVLSSACLMCAFGVQDVSAGESPAPNETKMEWWKNAKFGMFIHWGLYSQAGGIWKGNTGYGEWIMNEAKIPCAEYAAMAKDLNPKDFNAEAWVKLAKDAGQKYIVITSK